MHLRRRSRELAATLAICLAPAQVIETEAGGPWRELEEGLELGTFESPVPPVAGDARIVALRIDPDCFEVRLLNASAPGEGLSRSARQWCETHQLVAATNAAMYQGDHHLTSVSLMKTRDHVNNSRLTRDKAVLAFDPIDHSVPRVQIIDRACQDFGEVSRHYRGFVQSIRMVSCRRENVWSPQQAAWSTAAIATDDEDRLLFIHARSAYSTHDFIEALLALPLDIRHAMYAEGGSEAQLYVRSGKEEFEFLGDSSPGFGVSDDDPVAWPVPNVIGIVRIRPGGSG